MRVPRKEGSVPLRGERPAIETPQELADQLVKNMLTGTYRIVMADGKKYRLLVERKDIYVPTLTEETD